MEAEERLVEAGTEDDLEDVDTDLTARQERRHRRLASKNKAALERFLGKGRRTHQVTIVHRYYGELLTWALRQYMQKEGWQIEHTLGYHGLEPVYIDVNTNYQQRENLLMDGQMLLRKASLRLVVTVDVNLRWRNSVVVEGAARRKKEVAQFADGVLTTSREQNFYRGKKLEFAERLRFLDLKDRSWESIVLDEVIKKEIRANTIGFLHRKETWAEYGIPVKRGILLAGEPGTGKTVICKALMAEARGMTCITTNAYALDSEDYVTELYELAADLSPSLVFIEDVDMIGQNREEFGYQRGPALLSLLSVLDGLEDKKEIVTVATTNCLEALDKALSQRPSRFDRVIELTLPGLEQRGELVQRLCQRIPLEPGLRDYMSAKTDGCTPAQIQEAVYSLVIEQPEASGNGNAFREKDVDAAIARVTRRNGQRLGFGLSSRSAGRRPTLPTS